MLRNEGRIEGVMMNSTVCAVHTGEITAPFTVRESLREKNEFCFGHVEYEVGMKHVRSMDLYLSSNR